MSNQFQRTALLIGQGNIEKLKNRRVAVFGIGGVGGHTVEALCRCGVGALDIFDGDVVDVTNINRQVIATHKTVGRDKVDVMRERLLDINPDVIVGAHKLFYLPDTAADVDLSCYDYVVDAVDTMTAKLEIVCRAAAAGVSVISSMGAANKLDPTAFEVADIYATSVCPMARIMRRELRRRGVDALKVVYSKEVPAKAQDGVGVVVGVRYAGVSKYADGSDSAGAALHDSLPRAARPLPASIAFVPPVVGLIIASEVVAGLCDIRTGGIACEI